MKATFTLVVLLVSLIQVRAQVPSWKIHEVEADSLLAREDYPGALKGYSAILESLKLEGVDSYMILYKRAMCLYSLTHYAAALKDIDQFIAHQPDFYQATLLKGFIGREMHDAAVQVAALNILLEDSPENDELRLWRATSLLDNSQYAEARKDLMTLKQKQNNAELELYLGISYYYESKSDSAITCFDNAIRLDKTFMTPYLYAGSLCLDEEAYDMALVYLNSGLLLDPGNISMTFYKGVALSEKKNFVAGCRCLVKAFNEGIDDAGDYLKEYCYNLKEN